MVEISHQHQNTDVGGKPLISRSLCHFEMGPVSPFTGRGGLARGMCGSEGPGTDCLSVTLTCNSAEFGEGPCFHESLQVLWIPPRVQSRLLQQGSVSLVEKPQGAALPSRTCQMLPARASTTGGSLQVGKESPRPHQAAVRLACGPGVLPGFPAASDDAALPGGPQCLFDTGNLISPIVTLYRSVFTQGLSHLSSSPACAAKGGISTAGALMVLLR